MPFKVNKALEAKILPSNKPNMIDLVAQAGFDVSDWSNYKNGEKNPGANPRYCYEWCYEQEGMFILNIWYENMVFEENGARQHLNLRKELPEFVGSQKLRARKFDEAVRQALRTGSNPRVIIQHRDVPRTGSVQYRMLDSSPWTVENYDDQTGDFSLLRGICKVDSNPLQEAEEGILEGVEYWKLTRHRSRELSLRQEKIRLAKIDGGGRLRCEVSGCEFDFAEKYGELGEGYAHVHHMVPIGDRSIQGENTRLDDLVVVCANCHAMIHRNGRSRTLSEIEEAIVANV